MTYPTDGLTFNTLRNANINRIPQFKNKHGGLAHSTDDGSDWVPSQWVQALIGELGEYSNERKKFERGDLTFDEFKEKAAKELADVQIYLDILAMRCLDDPYIGYVDPTGVDLGKATISKFNEVSNRIGVNVKIRDDGSDLLYKNVKYDYFEKENRSITPTEIIYATVMPPIGLMRGVQGLNEAPLATPVTTSLPEKLELRLETNEEERERLAN